MDSITIRQATPQDAEALLDIYAYYVRNTAITFEYDVPTIAEFRNRIANTLLKYPYLVILDGETIVGYAYAGSFGVRAAYSWSAETTIYLAHGTQKRGYGRKIYEALEQSLASMGILNLYACIAYPIVDDEYLTRNSAQFHAHLGFHTVGEFHQCGCKFGRWYDMIWMEKIIGFHEQNPNPVNFSTST